MNRKKIACYFIMAVLLLCFVPQVTYAGKNSKTEEEMEELVEEQLLHMSWKQKAAQMILVAVSIPEVLEKVR